MTEKGCLSCTKPQKLLDLLRDRGKLSQRKARLFAVAMCRQVWPLLTDERSRRAVEVAERHADGLADDEELFEAGHAARVAYSHIRNSPVASRGWSSQPIFIALAAAEAAITEREAVTKLSGWKVSVEEVLRGYAAGYAANVVHQYVSLATAGERESGAADLLRDIFGPWPFRAKPVIAEHVLAWDSGCVVKLATAIYEERSLPEGTLDSVRLRVLADALEEAGVTGPDILGHLRQQGGVHVRGCWPVDLLTGRT
jgi:hypothetical protein